MSQHADIPAALPPQVAPSRIKTIPLVVLMLLLFLGIVAVILTAAHAFLPAGAVNRTVSTLPLFAHTFAFPLQGGAVLLILSALVLTLLGVLRQIRRTRVAVWVGVPALAALSGVFLIISATNTALPTALHQETDSDSPELLVVSWNAEGHLDRESARIIFTDLGADIAVLPEFADFAGDAADLTFLQQELAAGGADPTAYDIFESPPTGSRIAPVTVVVRKSIGAYRSVAIDQTTFGTLHLLPPDGSALPEIIAVHTAPPLPGLMAAWRRDLTLVQNLVYPLGSNALIAGDFNATMRHGDLSAISTHADAVTTISGVTRGTWPSIAPQFLRSSIDHVLVPQDSYAVRKTAIVEVPGSDHAGVVTSVSTTPSGG